MLRLLTRKAVGIIHQIHLILLTRTNRYFLPTSNSNLRQLLISSIHMLLVSRTGQVNLLLKRSPHLSPSLRNQLTRTLNPSTCNKSSLFQTQPPQSTCLRCLTDLKRSKYFPRHNVCQTFFRFHNQAATIYQLITSYHHKSQIMQMGTNLKHRERDPHRADHRRKGM
jgi:hypothetical protein